LRQQRRHSGQQGPWEAVAAWEGQEQEQGGAHSYPHPAIQVRGGVGWVCVSYIHSFKHLGSSLGNAWIVYVSWLHYMYSTCMYSLRPAVLAGAKLGVGKQHGRHRSNPVHPPDTRPPPSLCCYLYWLQVQVALGQGHLEPPCQPLSRLRQQRQGQAPAPALPPCPPATYAPPRGAGGARSRWVSHSLTE
jgi:hypothetical protein